MSEFLSDFQKQFGSQIAEKFSSRLEMAPEQAEQILPQLTPHVLESLRVQASSSSQAREAIQDLLQNYQENENDPEGVNFSSPLSPTGVPLASMLGGDAKSAAGDIASKFGIPPELAAKLLPILLPIIIGVISQKAKGAMGGAGQGSPGQAQGLPGMDVLGQILGGMGQGGPGGGMGGIDKAGCLSSILGGLLKGKR